MPKTQRAVLILFVVVFFVYTFPLAYNALITPFFHAIPSQDVVSASLIPVSILTRDNFYLDQYRRYVTNNYSDPYFVAEVNNHLVSRYPIASGVLSLPFIGWGLGTGWIARTDNVFDVAKFSAMLMAALTVVAFFFCARELTDLSTSILTSAAFAFGTSVWSTASQGLWQHTPSILFQSLGIWFLLRGKRAGALAAAPAGIFFSLAVVSRPATIVTVAILSLYVLLEYRAAFVRFILWALPPAFLFFTYNYAINGSALVFGYQEGVTLNFPQWEAIQGLLFSSGRGLFVYSPFLLLAPVGVWIGWVREHRDLYAYLALTFFAYTGIMAAWGSLGGWAYGARMLTDALPATVLLIVPVVERIRGGWRSAFWAVVILAAAVQSLGLYDYGVRFHADGNTVWSLEYNEPLYYVKLFISMAQETLGL